jgi:hypothetical protein
MDWVDRFSAEGVFEHSAKPSGSHPQQRQHWYQLILSLWSDIDSGVRKTIFENFVINATLLAGPKRTLPAPSITANPLGIVLDPHLRL